MLKKINTLTNTSRCKLRNYVSFTNTFFIHTPDELPNILEV